MANPDTNLFITYDAKGIREDLENAIYDISPEDTPVMSGGGRTDAENTLFEWQIDALPAATSTGATLEGADASLQEQEPTTRIGNYVQINTKVVGVSGTEEAVVKAGRSSDMAYHLARNSTVLKLDMEMTALANQPAAAGSRSVARQTAGFPAWLFSNTVFGSGGVDPVYTSIPNDDRTDGSQTAFAESDLKTVLLTAFQLGAKPSRLYTGPFNKNVAAGFSGIASKVYNLNNPGDRVAVMASIDVYVSNFGELAIIPTRLQRERDIFGLDPEMYSFAYLRPFFSKPLADIGDSTRRQMIVEWGLKVHNEKAHFGIYDKSAS